MRVVGCSDKAFELDVITLMDADTHPFQMLFYAFLKGINDLILRPKLKRSTSAVEALV